MSRRVLSLVTAVLVIAGAGWLFAGWREELLQLAEWARLNPRWSWPVYLVGFGLAMVLALPSWPLVVGGGYVFGVVAGWALASVAGLCGATAAFYLGRGVARDWVMGRVADNVRFHALDRAIASNGFAVVLLTRLSIVFPYNILNFAFGATAISARHFVIASWLGMQPVLALYVLLGAGADDLASLVAGGPAGSVNPWLVAGGIALAVGVLVLLARTARRMLAADLAAEPD